MHRTRVERLVGEHRPTLERLAMRLCGNPADRDDLVQQTVLRALERAEGGAGDQHGGGWLTTIMWHLFIDSRRKAERRRVHQDIDEFALAAPTPEPAALWRRVTDEQFESALARVEEDFRVPYLLFEREGLSHLEIAQRLGIERPTVTTRIRRARLRLREILERWDAGGADEQSGM